MTSSSSVVSLSSSSTSSLYITESFFILFSFPCFLFSARSQSLLFPLVHPRRRHELRRKPSVCDRCARRWCRHFIVVVVVVVFIDLWREVMKSIDCQSTFSTFSSFGRRRRFFHKHPPHNHREETCLVFPKQRALSSVELTIHEKFAWRLQTTRSLIISSYRPRSHSV